METQISSATTNERNRAVGRIGGCEKPTIPGQTGSQDRLSATNGEATGANKEKNMSVKGERSSGEEIVEAPTVIVDTGDVHKDLKIKLPDAAMRNRSPSIKHAPH
jgi:hypothetical protein